MSDPKTPFIAEKIAASTRQSLLPIIGVIAAIATIALVALSSMGIALSASIDEASAKSGATITRYVFGLLAAGALFFHARALASRISDETKAAAPSERWSWIAALSCSLLLLALGRASDWLSIAGLVGLGSLFVIRFLSGINFQAQGESQSGKRYKDNQKIEMTFGLVVAVLGIVLAYAFGLRAFQIPTGSMEPTLYGASGSGERAIVNIGYLSFADPKLGDITIFRYPLGRGQDYVKRNMGQGGDLMVIHAGDVYIRRPGWKMPVQWGSEESLPGPIWLPQMQLEGSRAVYDKSFAGLKGKASFEGKSLLLTPDESGEARTRYPAKGFLANHDPSTVPDPTRKGLHESEHVMDARVKGRLTIPEGASFEISFARTNQTLAYVFEGGGKVTLRKGDESEVQEIEVPAGEDFGFECAIANGKAWVTIDGESAEVEVLSQFAMEMITRHSAGTLDDFLEELGGDAFVNNRRSMEALNQLGMHIELSAKGDAVKIDGLAIDRDVHYLGRRKMEVIDTGIAPAAGVSAPIVHFVEQDSYYMLGDHSEDSLDSRAWFEVTLESPEGKHRFPLSAFFSDQNLSEGSATHFVGVLNAMNRFSTSAEAEKAIAAFEADFVGGNFGSIFKAKDIFGIEREISARKVSALEIRSVSDVPRDLIVGPLLGSVFPKPRFID